MNKYTYHISTIPFIFLCQTSFAESPLNEFDSNFFVGSNVSLDRFQKPGAVEPGDYEMSINLNGKYIGNSFAQKVSELDSTKSYYIYCRSGVRAKSAEAIMLENNLKKIHTFQDGMMTYTGEVAK